MADNYCFACDRKLGARPISVDTRDDQIVYVGSECAKLVASAGNAGWQPPKGGPRLYPIKGAQPPQEADWAVYEKIISYWTVFELRDEIRTYGARTNGNKAALVYRLVELNKRGAPRA